MGKPARVMSSLERVLYIWAVMFKEYHLIAGWLVLKAFSEWMATNEAKAIRGVEKKRGSLISISRATCSPSSSDCYADRWACGLSCHAPATGAWSYPSILAAFFGYGTSLI
jgi:hypothetical protein